MQEIKYKSTLPHDSFFGWLNLFKVRDTFIIYRAGQRPPYPIITSDPTIWDVLQNLNKADLGIFCATTFVGFFLARKGVGNLYSTEYLRRRGFSIAWNTYIMIGGLFALMNSNNRLTGFVDNGLEWRRKNDSLKKYDFTSEWEKGTIWSYFRLRDK